MKNPTITIEGETHKVNSVWWNEDGTIAHVSYPTPNGESVCKTVFGDEYDLSKVLNWHENPNR